MTKYTEQFKLKVIRFYFENNQSFTKTHHHFHLDESIIRFWIKQYQHSGYSALIVKRTKQQYSVAQKLAIISPVLSGEQTITQATLNAKLSRRDRENRSKST